MVARDGQMCMSQAFQRLERVLLLEKSQGYQNKAVVGGVRQFAAYWVGQAQSETLDEADQFLVEQVGEVLAGYSRLPGLEARARAVDGLLDKLQQRANRLRKTATPAPRAKAPTPPAPTPPPAPAPPPSVTPPVAQAPISKPTVAEETPDESPVGPPLVQSTPARIGAPDPAGLAQPVLRIRGVGTKLAELLAKLGPQTIHELLYLFPRRYEDFSLLKPIHRLTYGEVVTVIGTVWDVRSRRTRNNGVAVQAIISDGTGKVQAIWYNQVWLIQKLKAGMSIALSGKVDQYLGQPVFNAPEWEPLAEELLRTNRILPVYPLTKGLSSYKMRQIMREAVELWAPHAPDPVPDSLRTRHNLMTLPEALWQMHLPDSQAELHQARQRLIFDELLLLQLGMLRQRRTWQANPAQPLPPAPDMLARFLDSLPFPLTGAQQRVVSEIEADMARATPMTRLLQGDVGSGKTVVAAAAMLQAVAAGAQAALMAPTEILAEQHGQSLGRMLAPLGVAVAVLTGSMTDKVKETVYAALSDSSASVVVGTHALIQSGVQFHNLGLVVVDEQHRFGVEQRGALRQKGQQDNSPHLLVMSATPIPRTLALSVYGDLDLSILDEMPPGRQEIRTRWLRPAERERAYAFVRGQVQQGRQAYVICPLVEESDSLEEKSAVEEHQRLQMEVFPELRLGLLHGRMRSAEKEAVMRQFYAGEIDILVSTTVVEVGVDVPNSTVMLIEGADRFGLAQLHQLRGRVGRGEHLSYCLLLSDSATDEASQRLTALEQTNDGFQLAETDLRLRGPGEFFGRRQSGLPELRLASLLDAPMLALARAESQRLFAEDPDLTQPEYQALRERVAQFWEQAADVS